jgi:thioredoxin reductase
VEGEVASLEIVEDRLAGVRVGGGEVVALRVLALWPRFVARAEMFKNLGLETTGHPSGLGEQVEADATGLTAVPGVWVAGNVADLAAKVVGAAEAGVRAGAALNADLLAKDTERAVTAYRTRREARTAGRR